VKKVSSGGADDSGSAYKKRLKSLRGLKEEFCAKRKTPRLIDRPQAQCLRGDGFVMETRLTAVRVD
jgi:hypothetical protein